MRPSACGPTGASLHACDSNGCGCVRPETAHSGQTRPSSSRPATAGYEEAIVVGSVTPSYLFSPPDAALLQHELGIPVWQGRRRRRSWVPTSRWRAAVEWDSPVGPRDPSNCPLHAGSIPVRASNRSQRAEPSLPEATASRHQAFSVPISRRIPTPSDGRASPLPGPPRPPGASASLDLRAPAIGEAVHPSRPVGILPLGSSNPGGWRRLWRQSRSAISGSNLEISARSTGWTSRSTTGSSSSCSVPPAAARRRCSG